MRKLIAFFLAVLFVFGSFGNVFAGMAGEMEALPEPVTLQEYAGIPEPVSESEQTAEEAVCEPDSEENGPEPMREVYSGTCGDNLTWTLDTVTGLLEINGTGAMWSWSIPSYVPWYSYMSSVVTVQIGSGVTKISDFSFYSCSSLSEIDVDADNQVYSSLEGILFNKDMTKLIRCPRMKSGFYFIPNSVTSIDKEAFASCSRITSVTIPDGVTDIGNEAFTGCSGITSIIIPDSVTSIGNYAFSSCSSLASVDLPNRMSIISQGTFNNCTSLTSITIPGSVTSIGKSAFVRCSSLTAVSIPDSVTNIGQSAFAECTSLAFASIGGGIIETNAFSSCDSLVFVNICSGVTGIYNSAFYECSSLSFIDIPDSVTYISETAFKGCNSLAAINVSADNQRYSSRGGVMFNKEYEELLIYPQGKKGGYTVPDGVKYIGDYAFSGCKMLTLVTLPDSMSRIDYYAFSGCTALTSVIIPNRVTGICDQAFFGCTSLTSVVIGNNVEHIGFYAFQNCTSLTSLTIGAGVRDIDDYAFRGCTSLSAAVFLGGKPSAFGSTAYGVHVFDNCASGFCMYYTATHASEWAPNGENYWYYPIRLLITSDYCLAKFYTGLFSSAYSTSLVKKGERPALPTDPVKPGYRFAGWYTNSQCLGIPYCNHENNYLGDPIMHNTGFYAKWEEADLSSDWYSFTNTDSSFYSSSSSKIHKELISGEYFAALVKAYGYYQGNLNLRLHDKWEGSCFGMSAVAALAAANRLDLSFFQEYCECVHDLHKPKEDYTVRNLIEYYQLIQDTPITRYARRYEDTEEEQNCRRIIEAIDSSSYPVVIGFNIYGWTGPFSYGLIGGHAVLAFGYTIVDNKYRINIADPNKTGEFIHLNIERGTYKNLGFDSSYGDTYLKYALRVEDGEYDFQNIQYYLTGKGYTSGFLARDIEDEGYTTLTTNFNSFRIDGPNGEYAVIEYGEKTEGDLDIGSGQCMNDIGSELQLEFTVPVLGAGESYTVLPAECYSVVTEDPLEEYHALLICSGENGFWADSTAGSGAEFVFGSDGSVSTTCTEPCAQSATVCRNDMTTDWSCVTVDSAETATLTAVPTSDSAAIIADPDAEYDITVSSFHNDAVFEGIVGGSAGVTVTEDEHKNAVITYNSNSAVAASGVFGCSLIFCTMGGSEIETQTGIVHGTTAAAPYDPTRTGMLFGGWYTTYGCEEGTEWSFDTPLTEDTYIYAKWEEDEDYIHSVTFHIEDGFDTIYYVYNGEALTDYELPEIPEIEGYTASWPEIDLSCIMEDIVIEPIYAPKPTLTPGDVDGDGLVTMADVTLLSMYLNGENPQITEPGMANADANEDGTVDIRDIAAIYAIIAAS